MDIETRQETRTSSLKGNTLTLRHAIALSVGLMSPAGAVFFNTIPMAGLVGAAIPFCFAIAFVVVLLVAHQFSEMAKELPSSGSAYTLVAQGLHPTLGFLAGWVIMLGYILAVPLLLVLTSASVQELVKLWFGLQVHWMFWFLFGLAIVFSLAYTGIRQSLRVDLTFIVFEIGICLLLAFIVFFTAADHGALSLTPFSLQLLPKGGNFPLGVILAIFAFTGFEAAITLGEETRDPRKSIPRAVLGSMLVVGVFYVLMAYIATIGYGTDQMGQYAQDAAPFNTLGRRFMGTAFVPLIDIAGVISFFAGAIAAMNSGARVIYTIGREGLLPDWLSHTHRIHKTPANALILITVLSLVVGSWLGLQLTPGGTFGFLGTLVTLFVLVVYTLVNLACVRFFWLKRRGQFKIIQHLVLPVLATLITVALFIATFSDPGPAPLNLTPYIALLWIAAGIGVVVYLRRVKPDVLQHAGAIVSSVEARKGEEDF